MKKQWHIHRPDIERVRLFQRHLNCSMTTATIICNRGIDSIEAAEKFISPSLYHLNSPFTIRDMDIAVDRILFAISRGQRILILGDYDVDGITATVALFTFLKTIRANAVFYIPHRIDEGYGMMPHHVRQLALPKQIQLIITADNGSSSHTAIQEAAAAGIDVIVTDHHTIPDCLPSATAVVNPKRKDCPSKLHNLAGVGVAFSLLVCLRKKLREMDYWSHQPEPNLKAWCDLVALGTIADMVPLVADNRILTQTGIEMMNLTPRPGIKALMQSLGMAKQAVNAEDIAFRLAPRLNAAGRMAHAHDAIALLLAHNYSKAAALSEKLNHLNTLRKETETTLVEAIETILEKAPQQTNSIVMCGKNWHLGVLGIVASRITHRYFKPTIVFSEQNGIAKGSARSIPGLNVYDLLSACREDLIQFGGHASAAGLKLEAKHLPRFKERFEAHVDQMSGGKPFVEKVIIDCELFFDDIDSDLVNELERLQPFGQENPSPLFMAKNIEILSTTIIGQHHRRMLLRQKGNSRIRLNAIQFNIDPNQKLPEQLNQIAFQLQWNHWNGTKKIQLVVEEA